ncbi:hypothetical protein SI65_02585 [Aspergillus cristatus]|uniref:Dystroglycan-type cadherin-like domain-containing protein n=1 Tax=Aspergillus cristatus TaxID=573508 RepID=A0A1E3BLQ8_ASPCR|nr:hypothetical protein SI65_02585 [Aspergillus cristatus]
MALLGLIVLAFVLAVNASLSANYPVNAQLPPVARKSKPFEFVFSAGTFGGADANTKYSLEDAPSWLNVESKGRILSGTPQSEDVGEQKFKLVADGPSGSASMEVTLVVSAEDGPKPGKPLLPQLEKFCPTSAPSTIFVRPGDSFSLSFDSETFAGTRNSTVYYGTSPENSPLPSWVRFDPVDLRFSGTTPKGGPQSFTFNLIASDVLGFSAVTYTFEMAVRPHILSFNDTLQTFSLSRGDQFKSPAFHEYLTLDGRIPTEEDLTDISVEGPDWLTLDNKTLILSGTSPSDAKNENVTISITDVNEDVANMIVSLQYSQLFLDGVAGCDATIGEDFSYTFDESILTDDSVGLEVNSDEQLLSWLHYDAGKKKLHGSVPEDANSQKYTVDLTATKGSTKDTRKFTIDVAEAGQHDHTDTDKSVESGSATGTGGNSHQKKAGIIAIAVIIPCVFVASAIVLFFCWRRKRKGGSSHDDGDFPSEKPPAGPIPQPPLPQCQPFEDTISHSMPPPAQSPPPPSPPPKLELKPFFNATTFEKTDTFVTEEPAEDATADKENALPRSTVGWDFSSLHERPEQGQGPEDVLAQDKRRSLHASPSVRRQTSQSKRREPLKPIQGRRSLKRNSAASSRSKRLSKRSSGLSSVASGLPVRLSGAGHGAGGFGPAGRGSWQNTYPSMQSAESGLGNLAPLFPRPPPRARESIEYARRASMRALVRENSTISESDSLEAFVHTRAKSRNSTNPMFSGQSNRRTSSGSRALERKRSTLSRADTESTGNFSTYDQRQSLQERPYSMARSASIYTNDNWQSAYLPPASRMSSYMQASPAAYPSQSSLVQNYRDVLSPLPHFMTEASLAQGGRRLEDVEEHDSMVNSELQYGGGHYGEQRPSALHRLSSSCYDWRRMSTYMTEEELPRGRLQRSPSLPLDDPRGRMSSLWSAGVGNENEPRGMSSEQTWQTLSVEDSHDFPRDRTGSSFGAFL